MPVVTPHGRRDYSRRNRFLAGGIGPAMELACPVQWLARMMLKEYDGH